jgi:hypothetical protein
VRQAILAGLGGKLKDSEVLHYPGAKLEYLGPRENESVEQAKLLGLEGEPFLVIRKAWADLPDEPKGSISACIVFEKVPDRKLNSPELEEIHSSKIQLDVARCVAFVAQDVFPPRGTLVRTTKDWDKFSPNYDWETREGWHVTVLPSEEITISTAPGKKL